MMLSDYWFVVLGVVLLSVASEREPVIVQR